MKQIGHSRITVDDRFDSQHELEFVIEGASPCHGGYGCCGSCYETTTWLDRSEVEQLRDHLTNMLEDLT